MRQLHILFNSAKTWHVIVCWFLCFALNLPELSLKLFWTSVENNFRLSSGKFGAKHRNQQTITCQVLAELNIIWSCLIFIKLYNRIFFLAYFFTVSFYFHLNCFRHHKLPISCHIWFNTEDRIKYFLKLFRNIKQNIHQWSITKKVNGYIFLKIWTSFFIVFFFLIYFCKNDPMWSHDLRTNSSNTVQLLVWQFAKNNSCPSVKVSMTFSRKGMWLLC